MALAIPTRLSSVSTTATPHPVEASTWCLGYFLEPSMYHLSDESLMSGGSKCQFQ